MVVVEEPRPLVSVTLSVWSVCQNAGWWTSHCLRTASTTHGLRSPLPLQAHGEAAEMNPPQAPEPAVSRSHLKEAVYSPGRKVFTPSTQEQRTSM